MATAPASNTLVFLVTDVENSTHLWQVAPTAMHASMARHDAILRTHIEAHEGHTFKTAGDAFYVVFRSPARACAAALGVQRALLAEAWPPETPIRVRMALHAGKAQARDGDWFGPALNVVSRILSVARGGQTLLSGAMAGAFDDLRAAGAEIERHGFYRLKGIEEPVEIFEQGVRGWSAFAPPPDTSHVYRVVLAGDAWEPARAIRHNLPAERDTFVGRTMELRSIAERFDQGKRLVTVLGPAGTGKTRLACRYARAWLGDWPGGAWFCDLSSARDVQTIAASMAQALDVPLGSDEDAVGRLGSALAARGTCLLILDNFEHVAHHAKDTLGRWLDACPEASFLVTTRALLGVAGEQTLTLSPLPVSEAVDLFVQRARAARADFETSAEDAIIPLVRLLDGLPLAIELAAARARVMSPHAILARMGDRFRLLASSDGRLDRHATLRATLDWSWEQLPESEKAALAQLSVFEGSFSLEAAEAVVDLATFDTAPWTLDVLQLLVQKSLVRMLAKGRFDLLTSVREYAAEHLRSPGRYAGSGADALHATEVRHGAWYAALGEQRSAEHRGADLENFVAACRRAIARDDPAVAVEALAGAHSAQSLLGLYSAALDLATAVLAMQSLDPGGRARATRVRGAVLTALGRTDEARDDLEQAVTLARRVCDARCESRALTNLADLERSAGRLELARSHLAQALRLALAHGETRIESECRNALGSLDADAGAPQDAHAHYASALALARRLGDRRWEAGILGNIAALYLERGRLEEAEQCYTEALAAAREHGHRTWEGNMVANLGLLYLLRGDAAQARMTLQAAVQIARDIGHVRLECAALGSLALAEEQLGERQAAQDRLETAIELAVRINERRSEGQYRGYLGALHARAGRFEAAFASLDAGERLLRELDDRLSVGVLLSARAEALVRSGDSTKGQAVLEEARTLAGHVEAGASSELGQAITRTELLLADSGAVSRRS